MTAHGNECPGFNPTILYSLLAASNSLSPDLYRKISRELNTTIDRLERLIDTGRFFGDLPLNGAIEIILDSPIYYQVTTLAGMQAFDCLCKRTSALPRTLIRWMPLCRFALALHESCLLINRLSNPKSCTLSKMGTAYSLEIANSPFAIGNSATKPLCSFYSGFLRASTERMLGYEVSVEETTCKAKTDGGSTCLFVVATK